MTAAPTAAATVAAASTLGRLPLTPALGEPVALAYDDVDDRLYAIDAANDTVVGIYPATGATSVVLDGFTSLAWCGLEIDSGARRLTVVDPGHNRVHVFGLSAVAAEASYAIYGTGCAGNAWVPVLAPLPELLPWTDEPFALRLSNLPPSGLAFLTVGFSRSSWGGMPLPFRLAAVGMPDCRVLASPDVVFPVPITRGVATWSVVRPNSASLAGAQFFDQAFVADPGANALGVIVTNGGAGTIGRGRAASGSLPRAIGFVSLHPPPEDAPECVA